ncbi:CBK_G0011330.mRNA.1.CDS.1 [Saccharomyces cerevisiae]|nr:CBK_G0011330.mRNA.1.CDS.1 [Saccharomyces cerevisiae]CAI7214273.1 CBK_G0011330.mRNA.1.CDS.1 [Saccharomyces cerevisiae]
MQEESDCSQRYGQQFSRTAKDPPEKETSFVRGLFYRDILGVILLQPNYQIQSWILKQLQIYKAAWASLKHGSGTMDTLCKICSINKDNGKLVPRIVFDTSIMIISYISIGKYLETLAKSQTSMLKGLQCLLMKS